jgi:hypothetical protein
MVDDRSAMALHPSAGYNLLGTGISIHVQRRPSLGRIIRTTNPTRQRSLSIKKMTTAIQVFLRSPSPDEDILPLGTALAASLKEIHDSVDRTAEAWEKRDYWLKADAFRRQWSWAEKFHAGIDQAVACRDVHGLQHQILELGEKLGSLKTA